MNPAELKFDDLKFDGKGLIPAIVQDANTREVLTLAYMNRESLARTIETRETWFWSRSRNELWHKGETSGNTQQVVDLVCRLLLEKKNSLLKSAHSHMFVLLFVC